jgi:hypothetical protein
MVSRSHKARLRTVRTEAIEAILLAVLILTAIAIQTSSTMTGQTKTNPDKITAPSASRDGVAVGYQEYTLLTNLEYPLGLWVKGDHVYLTETAGRNTAYGGKNCLDDYDVVSGVKSLLVDNPENPGSVVVASDGKIYLTAYQGSDPGESGSVSVVDPSTKTETHLLNIEIASLDMFIDSSDNILIIGSSDLAGAKSLYMLPAGSYSTPNVLKTGLGRIWCISNDGSYTYFSNFAAVARFQGTSGQIETYLNKPVMSMSFAPGYLYYANYFGGTIGRIHLSDMYNETILTGLNGPIAIRYDAANDRIYFLEAGTNGAKFKDGTLKVLSKTPPNLSWKGSYISTYYSGLSWHPKIVEIHISAQDALGSGTTAYALVVDELASGAEQIAGKIPTVGTLLQTIFKAIAKAVAGNPDGSYDFTAMEVGGGIGWLYGGSFSKGTILPVAISYWPIPIALFNLPTPGQFRLFYQDVPNANLIQNAISAGQTIISLFDPNGRLYLMVQDSSGRRAGVDAILNETITGIPSSVYAEYRSSMAVVLPINATSFTCTVDGREASQQNENYTLTTETVLNGDIVSNKTFSSQINQGQVASYTVQISNGMIEMALLGTPNTYLIYLVPVVILVVSIPLFLLLRKRRRAQNTL